MTQPRRQEKRKRKGQTEVHPHPWLVPGPRVLGLQPGCQPDLAPSGTQNTSSFHPFCPGFLFPLPVKGPSELVAKGHPRVVNITDPSDSPFFRCPRHKQTDGSERNKQRDGPARTGLVIRVLAASVWPASAAR